MPVFFQLAVHAVAANRAACVRHIWLPFFANKAAYFFGEHHPCLHGARLCRFWRSNKKISVLKSKNPDEFPHRGFQKNDRLGLAICLNPERRARG
jgi:hypothetical protein